MNNRGPQIRDFLAPKVPMQYLPVLYNVPGSGPDNAALDDYAFSGIRVFVAGIPAPQGSKSFKGTYRDKQTGALRGIMVESSKKVAPWRADVRAALLRADGRPIISFPEGPVRVGMTFVMPRPKSTPKRRETPPAVKKPDGDKLTRSTLDAIKSAGVYTDDSQVTAWPGIKRLAELDEPTGCYLVIDRPPYGMQGVKWLH